MRLRGSCTGALGRSFLHSATTRSLWYAVEELEHLYAAKLAHAGMLASLYAHKDSDFEKGGDHVHEAYLDALNTLPYFNLSAAEANKSATDALVEEWRKANAELANQKPAPDPRKEAADADR